MNQHLTATRFRLSVEINQPLSLVLVDSGPAVPHLTAQQELESIEILGQRGVGKPSDELDMEYMELRILSSEKASPQLLLALDISELRFRGCICPFGLLLPCLMHIPLSDWPLQNSTSG